MNLPLLVAVSYLAQLWAKSALALMHRAQEIPPPSLPLDTVTILQPVTSGDARLAEFLAANAAEPAETPLIWIIDRSDTIAAGLCRNTAAKFPVRSIQIVEADEPSQGFNPKLWKQMVGLPLVRTEIVAVVDDDTIVPRQSLEQLVAELDRGATLATGLPCYLPARGGWSRLLAEFVNSAAILTYLPAAACTSPRAINGMCYAVRTEFVRRHDLFGVAGHAITDDLAIAKEVRRLGGAIVQTCQPQFISTTVPGFLQYRRLMHRWFVSTRILVQCETLGTRAVLLAAYGVPPLALIALAVVGCTYPTPAWGCFAAVIALRSMTVATLNRVFTGAWRHSPIASVLGEFLLPVFLAASYLFPVIWWRRRRIRVRNFNTFEYLNP